ncbi:MAG: MotA/TolQ/ExbB proton channel family protein [Planctomycetales bacterium]|nr:MotA/TolQ/ExbB proton channel family protein [Planctomycetales bacterium]
MENRSHSIYAMASKIGGPLMWGAAATVGYYLALQQGILRSPLLVRYTAGHPVEVVEVGMFFVGLVFLARHALGRFGQLVSLEQTENDLSPEQTEGESVRYTSSLLLSKIREAKSSALQTLLGLRIVRVLEAADRRQTSAHVDEELKYLSDVDAAAAYENYALPRIIVWATPMLGFLGTVIGITLALGDLNPEVLVDSPKEAMQGLLAGLSIAFDTTALALCLSITLMFGMFLSNQIESQLLNAIDVRSQSMVYRWLSVDSITNQTDHSTKEGLVAALVKATETLVERQTEVWQHAILATRDEWHSSIEDTVSHVKQGLQGIYQQTLSSHSNHLVQAEQEASERAAAYWSQVQKSSVEHAAALRTQQAELAKQNQLLAELVKATGDIRTLEDSLNSNLQALAGAKNFEDTVMSLSAAIHILSSRLGAPLPKESRVRLSDQAA